MLWLPPAAATSGLTQPCDEQLDEALLDALHLTCRKRTPTRVAPVVRSDPSHASRVIAVPQQGVL